MATKINTSLKLYKFLIRETRKLPTDAGKFYKTQIKAGFQQHAEEDDPERLQQIIDRALQDADWIIKKVKTKPYICIV